MYTILFAMTWSHIILFSAHYRIQILETENRKTTSAAKKTGSSGGAEGSGGNQTTTNDNTEALTQVSWVHKYKYIRWIMKEIFNLIIITRNLLFSYCN